MCVCVCVCVLEDVTEARVAEDERRRTRVEDSIENSGSSTATDKPYQCSVCVSIQTMGGSFQGQGVCV